MVDASLLHQVEGLPTADRHDLMGWLWDSLTPEPAEHELREARLGLAAHRADPTSARDWADVVKDAKSKYL